MEVIFYQADDRKTHPEVRPDRETEWLIQEQMGELFGRVRLGHYEATPKRIPGGGELDKASVRANFARTASDGKTYQMQFFNRVSLINRANE